MQTTSLSILISELQSIILDRDINFSRCQAIFAERDSRQARLLLLMDKPLEQEDNDRVPFCRLTLSLAGVCRMTWSLRPHRLWSVVLFGLLLAVLPLAAHAQNVKGQGAMAKLKEKINLQTDVEYGQAGEVKLKLDTLKPKAPAAKQLPCIVWIHGGGWQAGDKSSGLGRLAPYAASGDYVGVSVGYRLTDVASWPAQINDCKGAIRWVRAQADELGVDPEKIGVWGSSAGGHLVAMLGTSGDVKELEGTVGSADQSSRVKCVVDYFGPTDFAAFGDSAPRTLSANSPEVKLLGGTVQEKPDVAKQASPTTFVSQDDAPFLILHGSKDPLVPISQSELLNKKLKDAGVESTMIIVEGAGHGFASPEVDARVKSFFAKHLQGKEVEISSESIAVPAK